MLCPVPRLNHVVSQSPAPQQMRDVKWVGEVKEEDGKGIKEEKEQCNAWNAREAVALDRKNLLSL